MRIRYRYRGECTPKSRSICLALSVLYLFAACVSVQVEPLTQQPYPARSRTKSVALLRAEPTQPHVKLARIIATSHSASEDRLRDRILGQARSLGADAVILGRADVIESMGPSPLYQSPLSPAGTSVSPFGGGWWNPFYLDPWSFVQGGADQDRWTLYLSGVAIRYEQAEEGRR